MTISFLLIVSNANAGLISYDEDVNGDLDGITGTSLGILDTAGSNIINGFWLATPAGDTDRFNFTLGANLEILSIILTTTLENGENINASLAFPSLNLFDDDFSGDVDYPGSAFFGAGSLTASFEDTWDFGSGVGSLDTSLEAVS
ncbi:MAG: hypothetical protein OCD00_14105 [Colwellia sp.]